MLVLSQRKHAGIGERLRGAMHTLIPVSPTRKLV